MSIINVIAVVAFAVLISWSFAMSVALSRLQASVANLTNVSAGIITLVTGLAQQIRDNADDSDALNALADQLDADASNISTAITQNTPVVTSPGVQPDPTVPPITDHSGGADTTTADQGSDTLDGTQGTDTVDASQGADTLNDGNAADTIDGSGAS